MKLITKNLKGVLPSGEFYKIDFKDEYCDVWKIRFVHVTMRRFNIEFEQWIKHDSVCKSYSDVRSYTDTLRSALLEADRIMGIQLLKAELKIAI